MGCSLERRNSNRSELIWTGQTMNTANAVVAIVMDRRCSAIAASRVPQVQAALGMIPRENATLTQVTNQI
jgi:hypothetical protein